MGKKGYMLGFLIYWQFTTKLNKHGLIFFFSCRASFILKFKVKGKIFPARNYFSITP
jgi:hypothetical protein